MNTTSTRTAAVTLVWLPLLAALGYSLWTTPYPINETIALLEDVKNETRTFFDPTLRAWHRPLFF